jgi:SAM-dependent methyltransferase
MHDLSKKEIKKFILQKFLSGEFGAGDVVKNDLLVSVDRFSEIAYRFRYAKRILDVGSGSGVLLALLKMLGHDVYGVTLSNGFNGELYDLHNIKYDFCNIEVDKLPYEDNFFDAVSCCQALEHFTHSHLPPLIEIRRVLKFGGILEIDVPNAVCLRNRLRMLKGKHITWDYEKHYLYVDAIQYNGREFYPGRHNREFTLSELRILVNAAGFKNIEARYLESLRHRTGWRKLISWGSRIRYAIPSLRKSLITFAIK